MSEGHILAMTRSTCKLTASLLVLNVSFFVYMATAVDTPGSSTLVDITFLRSGVTASHEMCIFRKILDNHFLTRHRNSRCASTLIALPFILPAKAFCFKRLYCKKKEYV